MASLFDALAINTILEALPLQVESLKNIISGDQPCRRHKMFKSLSCKIKNQLSREGHHIECVSGSKKTKWIDWLLDNKELQSEISAHKWFGYVYDVLFPESVILFLTQVENVSYKQAEQLMYSSPAVIEIGSSTEEEKDSDDTCSSDQSHTRSSSVPLPLSLSAHRGESSSRESAVELLARGSLLQKKTRRLVSETGRIAVSSGPFKLRVVRMHYTRLRTYKKSGAYVEVCVSRNATYSEVASAAASAHSIELESSDDEQVKGPLCLFRPDGTLIPCAPLSTRFGQTCWTIGEYLDHAQKCPARLKLGVGYKFADFPEPVKNRPVKKRKVTTNIEVMYVASLGSTGFDTSVKLLRDEVYQNTVADGSMAQSSFQPEMMSYQVYSISVDGENVLCVDEHGCYTVLSDIEGDKFVVVHQSPSVVYMNGSSSVALFCIVSSHTLEYVYKWRGVEEVGTNSTVLWVSQPGIYHCTITFNLRSCSSALIHVIDRFDESDSTLQLSDTHTSSNSSQLPKSRTSSCISATLQESGGTYQMSDRSLSSSIESNVAGSTSSISNAVQGNMYISEQSFVDGSAMTFTKSELEVATDRFSDEKLVGKGGFGIVYKGHLRHTDVAVKLLSKTGVEMLCSTDAEIPRASCKSLLATEISTLNHFRHECLLELMGYCLEPPCLVYPYMVNGSLYDNLHSFKIPVRLTMTQRISVLLDVSRGLGYLHAESPPVVHNDINSSNILLDKSLCGKLSDFGFSIQLPPTHANKTLITSVSGLPGTNGYRPPEYIDSKYSLSSDIYSLGVVLLECFSGLVAYSEDRDALNLVDYTEEDRQDLCQFQRLADTKAGLVVQKVPRLLLEAVNVMIKRVPKRRPSIQNVVDRLREML